MSTSVSQLPSQVNANTVPKLEEDPMVQDVISEMEMEFSAQKPAAPKILPAIPVQAPSVHQAPVLTQLFPSPPETSSKYAWLDIKAIQKAGIFAALAVAIFFIDDLSAIYGKSPLLQKVQPYDKIVRGILLVIIYYVLLWKLKL